MLRLSILIIQMITLTNVFAEESKMATENERNTISIVKNNINSVVHVSNIRIGRNFNFGKVEIPAGAGTGWVWDNEGHIVTNFHVIDGGDAFVISFHKDGKQYKAEVVGAEPKKDLAVLKLIEKPATIKPLILGSSEDLEVGQKAIAIGNPFGLDHTVTAGIVSATDRETQSPNGFPITGVIQTDASINPGNSGGPLFDSNGKVIGVNEMIISNSGSNAGVGFAIPIDTVKRIVPQLIKYGRVMQPGLGIVILPDAYRQQFSIEEGVVIASLEDRGPADLAGLKGMSQDSRGRVYLGDIITAINGNKVTSMKDIYLQLENFKIGDEVDVTYLRDKKQKKVKVKLIDVSEKQPIRKTR